MPDSLSIAAKQYFGFSIIEWTGIFTALFTGTSVIILYYLHKANKISMPRIAKCLSWLNNEIMVVITNPSQIGIGVTDIYMKKKSFRFFRHRINCKWNHPHKQNFPVDKPVDLLTLSPQYIFRDDATYLITPLANVVEATYKIYVITTGGCCSANYYPSTDKV